MAFFREKIGEKGNGGKNEQGGLLNFNLTAKSAVPQFCAQCFCDKENNIINFSRSSKEIHFFSSRLIKIFVPLTCGRRYSCSENYKDYELARLSTNVKLINNERRNLHFLSLIRNFAQSCVL